MSIASHLFNMMLCKDVTMQTCVTVSKLKTLDLQSVAYSLVTSGLVPVTFNISAGWILVVHVCPADESTECCWSLVPDVPDLLFLSLRVFVSSLLWSMWPSFVSRVAVVSPLPGLHGKQELVRRHQKWSPLCFIHVYSLSPVLSLWVSGGVLPPFSLSETRV